MKIITPENILPEDSSYIKKGNLTIRKGTIAAAIANAKLYFEDRTQNKDNLGELIKLNENLKAIGLYDVFSWKDAELKDILESF